MSCCGISARCCNRACARATPWRGWAATSSASCWRTVAPEAAEKIAESLRQTVQNLHFVWKGRPFLTTVSIGLVHVAQTPTTLEASLRAADMACYMAKEKGRNRVQVYHADDSELSLRFGEMAWVQRLHMALEENRFCLYAQEIARWETQR